MKNFKATFTKFVRKTKMFRKTYVKTNIFFIGFILGSLLNSTLLSIYTV